MRNYITVVITLPLSFSKKTIPINRGDQEFSMFVIKYLITDIKPIISNLL